MKVYEVGNNLRPNKKEMTKEELKEMLKKYKGILNSSMIDYLNSLIELEFSIVREYISIEERYLLSELDIYKEIANYNICKRALNIIENNRNEINTIIKKDEEDLCIYADLDKSSILLFGYDYIGSEKNDNKEVGKITLYQTINSIEQIEKEIKRINSILETLYKEKNPHRVISNIKGGPAENWVLRHNNQIQMYENKLEKIHDKTELTETEQIEIEITNRIHDLFLEDFNLTNEDFVDNQAYKRVSSEQTELYKSYIKQIPKINIKNSIKYI